MNKILETYDIDGVEIFASGTWNGDKYTDGDLDSMIEAYSSTREHIRPYLKLGHDDGQKLAQGDGFPALGWVENLRRNGEKLLADFKKVPKKIYELIRAGAYRKVSSEIFLNLSVNGKKIPKMLKAVALLGADTPAVQTLDDIMSMYASTSEVRPYGEGEDAKTYEFEISLKSKEDEPMTLEQLQAQLADAEKKLAEAQASVKTYEIQGAELNKTVEALKLEVDTLTKKNQELMTKVNEYGQEKIKTTVDSTIDKLIKGKHLLPSQKAEAFTLLFEALNAGEEKKYKVGEKEATKFDFTVAFMEKGSVDVTTEEESHAGKRQDAASEDALIEKAKEFQAKAKAEGKEVSFRDALIEVSPAGGIPAEEKSEQE